MHKLTNVEAQRVMTVLSETLDRLNALSVVPTQRDDEMVEQLQDEGCGAVVSSLDAGTPRRRPSRRTKMMAGARRRRRRLRSDRSSCAQ